jgi:hypothetical protein
MFVTLAGEVPLAANVSHMYCKLRFRPAGSKSKNSRHREAGSSLVEYHRLPEGGV